ncbi:hypothetical protein H7E67_08090 [Clostridium gasigenes]|nr:hypothetical protein [Clostridium gasigenes]MBU3087991.1 hypothetical protein [Clostridium gasigenes]
MKKAIPNIKNTMLTLAIYNLEDISVVSGQQSNEMNLMWNTLLMKVAKLYFHFLKLQWEKCI